MLTRVVLWWDFFDPLGSLSDAVVSGYKWMTKTLQTFLATPTVNVSDTSAIKVLVTSQTNLALYLSYMALVLTFFLAVFRLKGNKIRHAVTVWLILLVVTPVWYEIMQGGRDLGFKLVDLVNKLQLPTANGPLNDFNFDNPIVGIMMMGWALWSGLILAMLSVSNEYWIVFVEMWFPVAFAVSMIGPRAKKVSDIILAIGITATVTSRAGMSFFLGMGEWAIDSLPLGNTALGAAVYSIVSYWVAMAFYIVLVFAAYKGINAIEGSVRAVMAGSLVSSVKNIVKVDINKWREARRGVRPMPVTVVGSVKMGKPGGGERLHDELKKTGKKAAVNGASIAASAAGYPAAGLAIKTVGNKVIN